MTNAPAPTLAEIIAEDERPRPELDAVMQRPDTGYACIPVEVTNPVTTHELPSRAGTTFTVTATTTAQMILNADRSRKRAVLISTDSPFYVAYSRNPPTGAPAAVGALWPNGVPLTVEHCDWITVFTPTGTATIAVATENWSD